MHQEFLQKDYHRLKSSSLPERAATRLICRCTVKNKLCKTVRYRAYARQIFAADKRFFRSLRLQTVIFRLTGECKIESDRLMR